MPWCPTCDRFLSPSTVHTDGTCPTCGGAVDPGHAHPRPLISEGATAGSPPPGSPASPSSPASPVSPSVAVPGVEDDDEDLGPLPWHLKLLAAALALYLGYRAFQGIEWLAHLL